MAVFEAASCDKMHLSSSLALDVVRCKEVILCLFIYYLFCSHCVWGFRMESLFCVVVLCVRLSVAIILLRMKELVAVL